MSASSLQFVFLNTTTIENLSRRTKVWQVAVYIPNPLPQATPLGFRTVTYSTSAQPTENQNPPSQVPPGPTRTFAILHSKPGENIWDHGPWRNFKAIMGERWYDWILPLRYSPSARHDRLDYEFEMGPVLERMKLEAGLLPLTSAGTDEKPHRHRRRRRKPGTHTRSGDADLKDQVPPEKKRRRHRRHRRHDDGPLEGSKGSNGIVN